MNSLEKIAHILRVDKNTIEDVDKALSRVCGRDDIMKKIVEENMEAIKDRLASLHVYTGNALDIYSALLERITEDDGQLAQILGHPLCVTEAGCRPILDAAKKVAKTGPGYFLKLSKAEEFLANIPPQKILQSLGYKDAKEMLQKEEVLQIYSALRFAEDTKWLNEVFFKQYEKLTPDDFEEREIKTIVLDEKWKNVAKIFLKKTYHNINHLKELGLVFVLPEVQQISGETLRTTALVLHYIHEVDFYSKLFKKYSKEPDFGRRLVSALRGDVPDKRVPAEDLGKKWMIVQRYLSKDDENDWRLFEPHVNPEAIHWRKAESDIGELTKVFKGYLHLDFWKDLDCIGDFYPTEAGVKVLVSFNLVDTVMALVKQKELIKYLYHHQEALWNRIFSECVGEEKMEELIVENFDKGYIELDLPELTGEKPELKADKWDLQF